MLPIRIENASLIIRAPPGSQGIHDLHVAVIAGCCVSRWEPTPDELAAVSAGGSRRKWRR